jgi:hypothetical protein
MFFNILVEQKKNVELHTFPAAPMSKYLNAFSEYTRREREQLRVAYKKYVTTYIRVVR